MLLSEGLGLMVWSPLAGGLLSGKYDFTADGAKGEGRRANFDFPPVDLKRGAPLVAAMKDMADKRGVSVAQIALAWLLYQPVVSTVIVGAKRADQLADNIASTEVELEAAEFERLDELSALPREYPGWMFAMQGGYSAGKVSERRKPQNR
jgi:aryl-alcohol dehydrogenase-like predicted oxidoreductase